jgi:hypothetical protein
MYKNIIVVFFVIICLGSMTAQTFIGELNPFPSVSHSGTLSGSINQEDTIKILGIMVCFQGDKDDATFGNGKFGSIYSADYGNSILDPLPHNKAYFESHLEFVKNYFNKVSNGKAVIEYFILPDTFSVSQTMRNYSPPNNSSDFTLLGNFAQEAWSIADNLNPGFDFGQYDLFTIFHAGVGRDVSLPGSLGTERDLPSVYLGENALKRIYGENFEGFPVSAGSFRIKNSMIIPETESRELETFGGTVLFELTINGLLAASIASHLSLPDLFDTGTGLSAIGRFGLMDGQSIFAYNGTFPPEPSAWEKIYLGWEEPVTIQPGSFNVNLAAKLAASATDTVILKVPINSSEYYLVENRARDVNNDGAIISYLLGGNIHTKTFTKDTTGFYSFDTDSVDGVVIDVDEFDWAIPSDRFVEPKTYNPKPGGGIVIWHIDENIINSKLAENKINTDKNNRGVDVEEADGVQDIGETFTTIFGDEIIGEGSIEDFWYASNPADLFRGRFSKDTRPNTNTNSGANSLITFSEFSEIANRMSFKVSYGDSILEPIFASHLDIPAGNKELTNSSTESGLSFNLISDSDFYKIDLTGVRLINSGFSSFKSAVLESNNDIYPIGAIGNRLNIATLAAIFLPEGELATTNPVIRRNAQNNIEILVGTSEGRVLIYSFQDSPLDIQLTDSIDFQTSSIRKIASENELFLAVTDSSFYLFPEFFQIPKVSGIKDNYNNNETSVINDAILNSNIPVILYEGNQFGIRHTDGNLSKFNVSSIEEINSFSMADLKNDGRNYILFTNGDKLEALNLQGASADNFPFIDPLGIGFTGTPLAADFEGDDKAEIIAYTKDGRIFAIDGGTGKVVSGFPLSTGVALATVPVLFNYQGHASLAAIDINNNFYVWKIGGVEGKLFWSEENGNNSNSSFISSAVSDNRINEFFPSNRAYNYPNPVYDDQTFIRYYVSEDSKINIKVFDLAGDFVAELNDDAAGGFDNETAWNVSDIQSGVYFARIEATTTSGKTESNIIKIAIIK